MVQKVILCVDDEKIILTSLKEQLKSNFGDDYIYETSDNANEALELIEELEAEKSKVLLIVSDWLMPGIKGDEFLIKVHEKYPNIVKVMLTGQANQDAIERSYKYASLHRCIDKPWKEEDLIETIKTGLEKL